MSKKRAIRIPNIATPPAKTKTIPAIADRRMPALPIRKTNQVGATQADITFFQSLRLQMGVNALNEPYKQHSWLYACISTISLGISRTPFKFWRGKDSDKKVVEDGELYTLFNKPNAIFGKYQFFEAIMVYLELEGEAVIVFERPAGKEKDRTVCPTEMWVYSGKYFTPNILNNQIIAWNYESPDGKQKATLDPAQVLQLKYFNPYNYYRGMSPLEACRLGVESDWQASIYNKSFFENSAVPDGVLIIKGQYSELTKPQRDAILGSFEDRHQGSKKAHRTAILEGDMDYRIIGLSHADMQFLEQKKWNREEVCACYKVPKMCLAVYEDINYATAKEAKKILYTDNLIPKMQYIEDAFWAGLFCNIDGGDAWGGFDRTAIECLAEDFAKLIDSAFKLWQMKYPINAINKRLSLGMEDVAWGDMAYGTMSEVPMDAILANEQAPPADEAPPTKPPAGTEEEAGKSLQKLPYSFNKLKYWNNYVAKVLSGNEKLMLGKIRNYLYQLRKDQLSRLAKAGDGKSINKLNGSEVEAIAFVKDEWDKKLRAMTRPILEQTMTDAGDQLSEEMGGAFSFDLTDPALMDFLNKKTNRITNINATMREQVKRSLLQGVAEQETTAELVDRLKTVFNFATNRALTIARTEISQMASGTRFLEMQAEGVKAHQWITAHDESVRESHIRNESIGAVPIGQKFPNGCYYPGDINGQAGEVINCRCVCVPIYKT